jgi:hypothetical protein
LQVIGIAGAAEPEVQHSLGLRVDRRHQASSKSRVSG